MATHFFTRFPIARCPSIPVRLILGYGFMEHGLAKEPDAFAILVEIFGGLAVILGLFLTLANLPMAAVVLLVTMFTVDLPYRFSSVKLQAVTATGAQFGPPDHEVDLLYPACPAALVLGRPGPLAIAGLKRRKGYNDLTGS